MLPSLTKPEVPDYVTPEDPGNDRTSCCGGNGVENSLWSPYERGGLLLLLPSLLCLLLLLLLVVVFVTVAAVRNMLNVIVCLASSSESRVVTAYLIVSFNAQR